MKIEVWREVEGDDDSAIMELYSEPRNMLEAMVDLRKCQLEHRPTNMNISLVDVEEGDV